MQPLENIAVDHRRALQFLIAYLSYFTLLVGCSDAPTGDIGALSEGRDISAATAGSPITRLIDPNKCIDVRGGSGNNGTSVQIYSCNQTAAQAWTVDGNRLRVLGGKCLDVKGGVNANGTALQIWDCVGNKNQTFTLNNNAIVWADTQKCVALTAGNANDASPLQIQSCAGDTNQQWHLGSTTTGTTPAPGQVACKRGMAYGSNSVADLRAVSSGVNWWYNWASQPDNPNVAAAYASLGMSYVPMLWNGNFDANKLATNPFSGSYLLGFNEPNFTHQGNLTPQQAAALWPQVEQVARAHQMKIVSPAVNYCGGGCNVTDPFAWLDQFLATCVNCQIDAIAMHWYACDKSALQWYLGQFESRYNKPLWLTEFACLDSGTINADVEAAYMRDALQLLESDPHVARYAWFTGRSTSQPAVNLLGADGRLTPLGQIYVSAPQACKP